MSASANREVHSDNQRNSQAVNQAQSSSGGSHRRQNYNVYNASSMNRVGDSTSKAVAQYTMDARLHAVFEQSDHYLFVENTARQSHPTFWLYDSR